MKSARRAGPQHSLGAHAGTASNFIPAGSSGSIRHAHLANEDALAPHFLSNSHTARLYGILLWLMWKFSKDEKGMELTFMGRVIQEAPLVAGEAQVAGGPRLRPRLTEPPFTCCSLSSLISNQPPSPADCPFEQAPMHPSSCLPLPMSGFNSVSISDLEHCDVPTPPHQTFSLPLGSPHLQSSFRTWA